MKPPTPNKDRTRIRDAFLIPAIFYVEITAAILVLLILMHFFSRFVAVSEFWASFFVFGIVLLGLVQMGTKIRRNVRERGIPPWNVALIFAITLLGPPGIAAYTIATVPQGAAGRFRQGEARMLLAELVESEEAFHSQFHTYSLSIKEVAYAPAVVRRYYAVGFAAACAVKYGLSPERAFLPPVNAPWAEAKKLEIDNYFRNVRKAEDCRDPKEGFEAFAVGVVRKDGPLDVWRVDEKRKLENLQSGN